MNNLLIVLCWIVLVLLAVYRGHLESHDGGKE